MRRGGQTSSALFPCPTTGSQRMATGQPNPSRMAKADFLSGIMFFLLGVYMIAAGAGMPGQAEVSFIEKGGEPGRVPIVVGIAIAICAAILLMRALGQGGHKLGASLPVSGEMRSGVKRSAFTALICTVYATLLIGSSIGGWRVPYEAATAVFVFAFIVIFDWPDAAERGAARWRSFERRWPGLAGRIKSSAGGSLAERAPHLWLLAMALIQAVITAAAVTYLFEKEFLVTLP